MKSSDENAHGSYHTPPFDMWCTLERLSGPDFADSTLSVPPCSVLPCPGESISTMSSEPGIGFGSDSITISFFTVPGLTPCMLRLIITFSR